METIDWDSALAGFLAALLMVFLVWAAWRIAIEPAAERHRLRKEAMHELRMDQLRSEIRLALIEELGEEEKSGDEHDSHNDVS